MERTQLCLTFDPTGGSSFEGKKRNKEAFASFRKRVAAELAKLDVVNVESINIVFTTFQP